MADASINWQHFSHFFMLPPSLESASSYVHRTTSFSTLNPFQTFSFAGMSTKGIFRLLVIDETCWPRWFFYHCIVVSLCSSVYLAHRWSHVVRTDCKLQIGNCLFTLGMHLPGAQQSKNDLTLRCCRNTSNNNIAKPPQSMGIHI